jgi:hypothetical protein
VLPSENDTPSDHAVHETLVNAGTARDSFAPIGSNLPDYDNYFCRDCRRIVHVRKGSRGFRACPTSGCTRSTGFGSYATTPRPRADATPLLDRTKQTSAATAAPTGGNKFAPRSSHLRENLPRKS